MSQDSTGTKSVENATRINRFCNDVIPWQAALRLCQHFSDIRQGLYQGAQKSDLARSQHMAVCIVSCYRRSRNASIPHSSRPTNRNRTSRFLSHFVTLTCDYQSSSIRRLRSWPQRARWNGAVVERHSKPPLRIDSVSLSVEKAAKPVKSFQDVTCP